MLNFVSQYYYFWSTVSRKLHLKSSTDQEVKSEKENGTIQTYCFSLLAPPTLPKTAHSYHLYLLLQVRRFFCTSPPTLCTGAGQSRVCPWPPLSKHYIMKIKPALASALMKFSFSQLILLLPFSKHQPWINVHLDHHLSH